MTCVDVMYQQPLSQHTSWQPFQSREPSRSSSRASSLSSTHSSTHTYLGMQEPLNLGAPQSTTSYASSTHLSSCPSSSSPASFIGSNPGSLQTSSFRVPLDTSPSIQSHLRLSHPSNFTIFHTSSLMSSTVSDSTSPTTSLPSSTSSHPPFSCASSQSSSGDHSFSKHGSSSINDKHIATDNFENLRHQQPEKTVTKTRDLILGKAEGEAETVALRDLRVLPPHQTYYMGANCIMHTFFSGDCQQAVEEHFTRSLQEQGRSTETGTADQETPTPMSHRKLPASFWNSSFYKTFSNHYSSQHYFNQYGGSGGTAGYNYHYPYPPFHHYYEKTNFPGVGSNNTDTPAPSDRNANSGIPGSSNLNSTAGVSGLGIGSGNELSSALSSHSAGAYLSAAAAAAVNSDPWSAYCSSLTSSSAPVMPYPYRPTTYDIGSYQNCNRFSESYGPLLMQPTNMTRPATHFGVATKGNNDDTKSPNHVTVNNNRLRYSDTTRLQSEYAASHQSSFTAALDATSLHEGAKDLYWF